MSKKVKGIHLEIGGDTTGLNKALSDVNKRARDIQGELAAVDKCLRLDPTNVELLEQKQRLLAESVENTTGKLEALKKAKEQADGRMASGDTSISGEQYRRLQREIVIAEKKLEELGEQSERTGSAIGNIGKGQSGIAKLRDTFSALKDPIEAFSGVVKAVKNGISALEKETREYREDMKKLEVGFEASGKSADEAQKVYSDFYGILGESDRAVEAVNHLAELCDGEADLTKWSKIAAGVTAKFGDSLPIEGLTEAANETAKVGKTTGVLADALNWASSDSKVFADAFSGNEKAVTAFNRAIKNGESVEDAFSEALAKMSTEQERAAAVTETLNGIYAETGEAYLEANAEVIKSREAQEEWTEAMAKAGEAIAPVVNAVVKFGASALSVTAEVADGLNGLLEKNKEIERVNEELSDATDNFESAKDAAEMGSERVEEWRRLSEQIDGGTLSSNALLKAQERIKEIEKWFADNYGEYVSAEEAKNGVRAETVDSLEREYEIQEKIKLLELQKTLSENVDKIPEIENETELLKGKTQALYEQNDALLDSKLKIATAQVEWNSFIHSDDFNDLDKRKEKIDELNAALKGITEIDAMGADWQLSDALGKVEEQMSKLNDTVTENEETIRANEQAINQYKLAVETLSGTAPELAESFKVLREGPTADLEKQIILQGGYYSQMIENAEAGYSGVTSAMIKESANQYNIATEEYEKIGKAIPDGIKMGIENGKPYLKSSVKSFTKELKSWFTSKDALDTHSPSKWSEGIARFVDEGFAIGFIKNSDTVKRSMKELFGMMEDERKAFTEDITLEEKRYNEELERIRSAGTEKANEAYLEGLKALADDAKEKRSFIREQYKATVDDIKDTIDDLEKRMESYRSGLANTDLVAEDKYVFTVNGKQTSFSVPRLADLSPKKEELETFISNLNSLKELGIDDTVIEQIKELGGEEGGKLAQALLFATPEEREAFIDNFKAIGELSGAATAEVFKDELVGVADDLKSALDELAPDLLQTGEDWGHYLGEGIVSTLKDALKSVGVMADYAPIHSGGTNVTYNTNIENNIEATPNTANEVSEAVRRTMMSFADWGSII